MKHTLTLLTLLLSSALFSQNAKIGKQTWMQKNLEVVTFRNGDSIPQAKTDVDWVLAGVYRQPAWCYYTDASGKIDTRFGKLYNWYAVSDPRGLAPVGWHIPTKDEWEALSDEVGTKKGASKLKTATDWKSGEQTNSSGFSAQPGGKRDHETGKCSGRGSSGTWWSASGSGKDEATDATLTNNLEYLSIGTHNKMSGYSVRCIEGDVVIKGKVRTWNMFADSIIGITTKIGNLEFAKNDFPGMLSLYVAQAACAKLGPGWRLPTQKEVETMFANRSQIGGFINAHYWYYDSDITLGWLNFLDYKMVDAGQLEFARGKARAVRTIQ
jgi:uncharacterized protein (TIGR02145 family)